MNSTLAALRQFVHREYNQQIREIRSGWNRPLAERIVIGKPRLFLAIEFTPKYREWVENLIGIYKIRSGSCLDLENE